MNKKTKNNNVVKNYGRHGDLLIQRIDSFEGDLETFEKVVLAEGEHTGHKHLLSKLDENARIEFADFVDHMIFKVEGGNVQLVHEEHKQIIFEPGIYKVTYEQEYDYFNEEIQKVLD